MAAFNQYISDEYLVVSTHSHPKVAAMFRLPHHLLRHCFNTQPPEGGCLLKYLISRRPWYVSTHSHPKVAACAFAKSLFTVQRVSTHSHPKVAASWCNLHKRKPAFQHTATRRWLHAHVMRDIREILVSTHSHPKVAALFSY